MLRLFYVEYFSKDMEISAFFSVVVVIVVVVRLTSKYTIFVVHNKNIRCFQLNRYWANTIQLTVTRNGRKTNRKKWRREKKKKKGKMTQKILLITKTGFYFLCRLIRKSVYVFTYFQLEEHFLDVPYVAYKC